jgi:DNA-binding NarL/FixJ family response regulator
MDGRDGAACIRVVLVDDHEVVRTGLRHMLERCRDIVIVGEAANANEALSTVAATRPDIVLLDLKLPGRQGLDVLPELISLAPSPQVLVLTVHDDEGLVLSAVRAGAAGYVLKHAGREELAIAIRRVHQGGNYFSPDVLSALVHAERDAASDGTSLTPRELEILQLLAQGRTNREIGERLFLSADTIKTHLRNLYRKLEVDSRAHAVAIALRRGLVK